MAAKHVNREVRRVNDMVTFAFICEGCGAEGNLTIDMAEGHKPFGCPDCCGATYVPWTPPCTFQMQLECVVCPVFERTADVK